MGAEFSDKMTAREVFQKAHSLSTLAGDDLAEALRELVLDGDVFEDSQDVIDIGFAVGFRPTVLEVERALVKLKAAADSLESFNDAIAEVSVEEPEAFKAIAATARAFDGVLNYMRDVCDKIEESHKKFAESLKKMDKMFEETRQEINEMTDSSTAQP